MGVAQVLSKARGLLNGATRATGKFFPSTGRITRELARPRYITFTEDHSRTRFPKGAWIYRPLGNITLQDLEAAQVMASGCVKIFNSNDCKVIAGRHIDASNRVSNSYLYSKRGMVTVPSTEPYNNTVDHGWNRRSGTGLITQLSSPTLSQN